MRSVAFFQNLRPDRGGRPRIAATAASSQSPFTLVVRMMERRNSTRRRRLLVAATAMAFHSSCSCTIRISRRRPLDAESFVEAFQVWRSSNKRFGINQRSRRRLFSLYHLRENADEEDLTSNHHGLSGAEATSTTTTTVESSQILQLYNNNQELRQKVESLEEEVRYLRAKSVPTRIVLESFEGENRLLLRANNEADNSILAGGVDDTTGSKMNFGKTADSAAMWCDELEDEACPVEPMISFGVALRDRALWLVGLLMLQSFSGIILAHNEGLLTRHPEEMPETYVCQCEQASVRVIRGLALGTLNDKTQSQFLTREVKMAGALAGILSMAGFLRTIVFRTPLAETLAVTSSLAMIVLCSVCLGAVLPIGLKKIGVDPAHSSTSIQVLMDILGVVLAVAVSSFLLDSTLGKFLISKLIGSSS